jgi:hypothetical protein
VSAVVLVLKTKDHAIVNYYMHLNLIMHVHVLSHALGPMGRYFVLNFRIPTVFDKIPLELVCFRNSRYSVSLRSFLCPTLPFSLSFSYSNVKVENN